MNSIVLVATHGGFSGQRPVQISMKFSPQHGRSAIVFRTCVFFSPMANPKKESETLAERSLLFCFQDHLGDSKFIDFLGIPDWKSIPQVYEVVPVVFSN